MWLGFLPRNYWSSLDHDLIASIWEKAISILAGNLNSGRSYLITAVQNKFLFSFIFLTDNNASSGPDSQDIQDSIPKYYSDFFATELAMPEWEAWATIISLSLVIIGVARDMFSRIPKPPIFFTKNVLCSFKRALECIFL